MQLIAALGVRKLHAASWHLASEDTTDSYGLSRSISETSVRSTSTFNISLQKSQMHGDSKKNDNGLKSSLPQDVHNHLISFSISMGPNASHRTDFSEQGFSLQTIPNRRQHRIADTTKRKTLRTRPLCPMQRCGGLN
jgi:hypothetical protein